MKNNHKISTGTVLIEAISIILAVLLGFIVNEWRENLNHKAEANAALQRIAAEMEQNHLKLKEKNEYYKHIINVLDSLVLVKGNDQLGSVSVPGWTGINPPILSSSSYKTASTIGVFSYIDFTIADKISKVYLMQDELQKLSTTSIHSLISGDLYDYRSIKLLFVIYTELIEGWENSYKQVLKIYNKKNDID